MPINFFTGKEYQGRNATVLPAGEYATFLQWRDGGYKVLKGSKGRTIFKVIKGTKRGKDGKDVQRNGLRAYTVFAKSQVELIA